MVKGKVSTRAAVVEGAKITLEFGDTAPAESRSRATRRVSSFGSGPRATEGIRAEKKDGDGAPKGEVPVRATPGDAI